MHQDKKSSMKPVTHSGTGSGTLKLEKVGVREFDITDPYHLALTMSWPQFFSGLFMLYAVINSCFALLYYVAPGSVSNMPPYSLRDAFFFSIETLATVGYGHMAPITTYSHTVSAIEMFVGMVLTATMTGLVFVRFSKPKAKLLFASHAVVVRRSGVPSLMIRIGNGRMNALNDARVRVTTFVSETAADGQKIRSMVDLRLSRSDMPFFPLTWTLIHELTDDSPLVLLRSVETSTLHTSGMRLLVSITAHDPALGAQVFANYAYGPDQIALDTRYTDAITHTSDQRSVADMRKISDMQAET